MNNAYSSQALLEVDGSKKLEGKFPKERLWRIIQSRDPRYFSAFVFAVRSTGVFCRPTCPSRRAGRSRVLFFSNSKEAKAAGFRACLRCRPEEDGKDSRQEQIVKRACSYIEENFGDKLGGNDGLFPCSIPSLFKRLRVIVPNPRAFKNKETSL